MLELLKDKGSAFFANPEVSGQGWPVSEEGGKELSEEL
jgi:hypothetical protein